MTTPLDRRFEAEPDLAAVRVPRSRLAGIRIPGPLAALPLGPGKGAVIARKAFRVPWASEAVPAADGFPVRIHAVLALAWNESAPAALSAHLATGPGERRSGDLLAEIAPELARSVGRWIAGEPAAGLARASPADLARTLRRQLAPGAGSPVACLAAEGVRSESEAWAAHRSAAAGEAVRDAAARLVASGLRARWRLVEAAEEISGPPAPVRETPPAPVDCVVAVGTRLVALAGLRTAGEIDLSAAGLGPLRSVRVEAEGRVLAGARDGVLVLEPGAGRAPVRHPFRREGREGRGANAVRVLGDAVVATHGEHGLVAWAAGEDGVAGRVLDSTPGARGLLAGPGGRLVWAAGDRVLLLEAGRTRPRKIARAAGEITALARVAGWLVAGTRCGRVQGLHERGGPLRTLEIAQGPVLGLAASGPRSAPILLVACGRTTVRGIDFGGALQRILFAESEVGILASSPVGVCALSLDRRVVLVWRGGSERAGPWTAGARASDVAAVPTTSGQKNLASALAPNVECSQVGREDRA